MNNGADASRRRDKELAVGDMRRFPLSYLRLVLTVRAWALCIPIVARDSNLSAVLARTAPPAKRPFQGFSPSTIWRCCHKAVKRPWLMRDRPCLREGLLLNRFLVMAGHDPTLHFGVDKTSLNTPAIRAHCWIRLGDRVFNPPDESMVEIHTHRSLAAPPIEPTRRAG